MRQAGGLSSTAVEWIEDLGENGLAQKTEHFSGAELAGLVRSAASFALARTVELDDKNNNAGIVMEADLKQALKEVRPALGKQDDILRTRFPLGISNYNSSVKRITRDLERFTAPIHSDTPRLQSLLLVGAGGNGGAGVTAVAAWAAAQASANGSSDYVRFVTALDVLSSESGGGDEARAAALVDRFAEAREMSHSLLVLDDVDQLCAGTGVGGYSSIMIATLRALLRSPPASASTAKAGGQSISKRSGGKTVHILAATSRSDAACSILYELFDETIGEKVEVWFAVVYFGHLLKVVPLLTDAESVRQLLSDSLPSLSASNVDCMSESIIRRLGNVGCKTALRLAERAVGTAERVDGLNDNELEAAQLSALDEILEDLAGDEVTAQKLCEVL